VARANHGFRAPRTAVPRYEIVQGTRATYEVTVGEVEALRAYIAEQAGPEEADAAERLLGQLATLAQHQAGTDREQVEFSPAPASAALAARAMDALRTEGDVRMGGPRWRLQRPRSSSASKSRLAPGKSPGDAAS
jgi:hypothetical protein